MSVPRERAGIMASTIEAAQNEASHPGWMEVDLAALASNYRRIGKLIGPSTRIIASIKANAYGHGVEPIAETLVREGCPMLATGSVQEAIRLRKRGIEADILMFGRCLAPAYRDLLRHRLIPTIHAPGQAETLNERATGKPLQAFVKVDAGLGRLGFPVVHAEQAILQMALLRHVHLRGIYTHLPFGREAERDPVERSVSRFADLVERLRKAGLDFEFVQANASAGILSGISNPFNSVCPGHALYGLEPAKDPLVRGKGFRPVLSAVRTRLIQVTDAEPSTDTDTAGYGLTRHVTRRGVLPFGQAESLCSTAQGVAQVLVNGRRAPIIGISFEHAILDLSGIHSDPGDLATLVGEDRGERITLEEFAAWRGGTVKDALCGMSGRLSVQLC